MFTVEEYSIAMYSMSSFPREEPILPSRLSILNARSCPTPAVGSCTYLQQYEEGLILGVQTDGCTGDTDRQLYEELLIAGV